LGAITNFFAKSGLRYHHDIYPLGKDGKPNCDAEPLHKKGDIIQDEKTGKPIKDYDYNFVYNVSEINTAYRNSRKTFNPETKKDEFKSEIVSDIIQFKLDELKNPFKTATPGMSYKAKDDSVMEKLTEKMSQYFNSIFTGSEYKAWKPTEQEIAELKTHITDRTSKFFESVNKAYFMGTGQEELNNKVEQKREEKKQKGMKI